MGPGPSSWWWQAVPVVQAVDFRPCEKPGERACTAAWRAPHVAGSGSQNACDPRPFMVKVIRDSAKSTVATRTLTSWPTCSTSLTASR